MTVKWWRLAHNVTILSSHECLQTIVWGLRANEMYTSDTGQVWGEWMNSSWRLEWRIVLRRNWWGVDWNVPVVWKEWEMTNWQQRYQMPRKWEREKEARKPRMRSEDCIYRNLERAGGEWRTTAKDRRRWRQLIENVERRVRNDKAKDNGNQGQPHLWLCQMPRGEQHILQDIVRSPLLPSRLK